LNLPTFIRQNLIRLNENHQTFICFICNMKINNQKTIKIYSLIKGNKGKR